MGSGKPIDIEILNCGYRYALSLSSNKADAEDIVHDAWIRLDRRYNKAPEKTLLYTTIRNPVSYTHLTLPTIYSV